MVNPRVILDFFFLFSLGNAITHSIITHALKCLTFFSNQGKLKTEPLTREVIELQKASFCFQ